MVPFLTIAGHSLVKSAYTPLTKQSAWGPVRPKIRKNELTLIMDGSIEEAVLAKDDPEEDFIDADDTIDERSEEEILKEILNRGGVPSRPSHHIVRDNEIESLKQGLADLGLLYLKYLD